MWLAQSHALLILCINYAFRHRPILIEVEFDDILFKDMTLILKIRIINKLYSPTVEFHMAYL